MPTHITKTDLQKKEYYRKLDRQLANKLYNDIYQELENYKKKKMLTKYNLKGLDSKFNRQINKINQVRNTYNRSYRNKWYTTYNQEMSKLK